MMTIDLSGKRGLVVGISNEHSLAWAAARHFPAAGAELAITYHNERSKAFVAPLAEQVGASLLLPCDVLRPGDRAALLSCRARATEREPRHGTPRPGAGTRGRGAFRQPTLRPTIEASIVNRALYSALGNRGCRWLLRGLAWSGDARRFLRMLYGPARMRRLLLPWAQRRYRSQREDASCNHVNCTCIWCRCGVAP